MDDRVNRATSEAAGLPVRPSKAAIALVALIAALALVAAGTGLFAGGGDGPAPFTTARGQAVELYGRGHYRYDTVFIGAGNRGTDAVTLAVGLPLLAFAALPYRRGSLRGAFLLTGALAYFLYVCASLALGAAYNSLFLVYAALFSAGLFALALVGASLDLGALAARVSPRLPRRGPALFMFASALVTLVVWLGLLVGALRRSGPPAGLDGYTTMVTDVLDLGLIVPTAALGGALLPRRAPLGYVLTFALLGVEVMLGPVIAAQTVSQVAAGVSFAPAPIAGPIAGFALLALAPVAVLAVLLRHVGDGASPAAVSVHRDVPRAA